MRSGRGAWANSPLRCRNSSALTPSETTLRLFLTLFSAKASRVISTSPGSSSTRSTWIMTPGSSGAIGHLLAVLVNGQRPADGRARRSRGLRVDPDPAAVEILDLPAQSHANARPRVGVPRMQSLKDHEYPLSVRWFDPNSVVLA